MLQGEKTELDLYRNGGNNYDVTLDGCNKFEGLNGY